MNPNGMCEKCSRAFDDHKLPTPVAEMMGLSVAKPVCPTVVGKPA